MKKLNTILKHCLVLMAFYTTSLYGQLTCIDSITVALDPDGTYILFPEDVLPEIGSSGYTATVSPSNLSCNDLGYLEVTLTAVDGPDDDFTCTTIVHVTDVTSPVAACVGSLNVELDGMGVHHFSFEELDNGSADVCETLTYLISPSTLTCESANPTAVTLTIIDGSGNSDECTVNVSWDPYPNPFPALACNDLVVVTVAFGEQVTITPDMILEGGPYGCPIQYEVVLSENLIPRPEPIVTIDDTNKVFMVTITDLNSPGSSCWGNLVVTSGIGCDPVFEICDTECRGTPVGDCASGHTDQDNVEWPCDLDINMTCDYYNLNYHFSPEFLEAEGLASPEDAMPQLINGSCYLTSTNYTDLVFLSAEPKWIKRTWSIIYWNTGQVWSYIQRINMLGSGIEICDTLPWNTPVGDCASGHTDTDDVEWPADITVNSLCIHPDDLAMNPDVADEDVRPVVFSDCNAVQMSYNDVETILNDSTVQVERTWQIHDFNTSGTWTHVQLIEAHTNPNVSLVCVIRENGEPIPDVELVPGIYTGADGCHVFENPEGITVTPIKDSPIEEGVNLLDKILIMEHVLSIRNLSQYQLYAADLSQNGIVSTLDVVMLDKILNGTFNPTFEHNWKFFERNSQAPSIDISDPLRAYKFVGVKMGDIDNSFDLGSAPLPDIISLTINDEILNQKEEYMVPFYLEKNERISGYSVQIRNDDNNIEFLNVLAPSLPGFDFESNVTITSGLVTINWIAPEDYLRNGVSIPEGTPLFIVELKPLKNTILSETLTLESADNNFLKPGAGKEALALKFAWENIIISSVLNPGQAHKLQFYPNPVSDEIHFQGFDPGARGTVSVADATGRIHLTSGLNPVLDAQRLEPGMYYLAVRMENGETFTAPFIKIK